MRGADITHNPHHKNRFIMTLTTSGERTGHLKGFTLIELLVVIAIIGILSSVVLASLNTARNKGADAATKSNLDSLRAQAEIFYDGNTPNSYTGICTAATTTAILTGAVNTSGATGGIVTTAATAQSATNVVCHESATAWAASAPLKSTTATAVYWCVDSTGVSAPKVTGVAANATVCS
jgi:prepilin-type N-terminal cleavage/methylation domain-containing protein